jgi:hypothetical protein
MIWRNHGWERTTGKIREPGDRQKRDGILKAALEYLNLARSKLDLGFFGFVH